MYTKIRNMPAGVSGKTVKSVVETLQKEGYSVKTNLQRYPNQIFGSIPIKFGKYTPDIFAFRGINDILVVEFENCIDIKSHECENKWKMLASKSCFNLHIIVPSCCKEKANLKSRIKNIPVTIHSINDWENSLIMDMSK